MKAKETSLKQLLTLYKHPSAALFRAIELKAIYECLKYRELPQPSLDLGCGDGKITQLLFDDQFTYGVDNGEANDVEVAIKNKVYKKVLLESAEKMSLPDKSVNFVFSNSVIEHIPDNEKVLSEVSRILKKDGIFVFTSPSDKFREYLFLSNILKKLGLGILGDWYIEKRNQLLNHYHIYSHSTWRTKLEQHGLKLVRHAYYIPQDTLRLWDKMALLVIVGRPFNSEIENLVSHHYKKEIEEHYQRGTDDPTKGGSVFIFAQKI